MKKRILLLLALVGCLCACLAAAPAFAEPASDTICVTGADILRGARSNVNRELTGVNITADGVELRGAFEADKRNQGGGEKGRCAHRKFFRTGGDLAGGRGL